MKGETSKIRFSEAQKLLDYGFSNYEYIEFTKKNDTIKTININKGFPNSLDLILESDSGCIIPKGKSNLISTNIEISDNISTPINKGQVLGKISYLLDGTEISTINIIAKQDVKKLNYINMTTKIIENWFTLFRIEYITK